MEQATSNEMTNFILISMLLIMVVFMGIYFGYKLMSYIIMSIFFMTLIAIIPCVVYFVFKMWWESLEAVKNDQVALRLLSETLNVLKPNESITFFESIFRSVFQSGDTSSDVFYRGESALILAKNIVSPPQEPTVATSLETLWSIAGWVWNVSVPIVGKSP
jgi:hypothetical protein